MIYEPKIGDKVRHHTWPPTTWGRVVSIVNGYILVDLYDRGKTTPYSELVQWIEYKGLINKDSLII